MSTGHLPPNVWRDQALGNVSLLCYVVPRKARQGPGLHTSKPDESEESLSQRRSGPISLTILHMNPERGAKEGAVTLWAPAPYSQI